MQARNKYGLGKPSKTFSFTTLGFGNIYATSLSIFFINKIKLISGQTPTEIFNEEILEEVEEKEDIIKEIKVSVIKTSGFESSSNSVGFSVPYATMVLAALNLLMF